MYRLADDRGRVLGVFDTIEEAQRLVPEVERWRPARKAGPEDLDGFRPDWHYYDPPHFTIRRVA